MLAAIFIYGGTLKVMDPKAFARILSHYDFVPEFLLPVIAVGLPLLEILTGIALILNLRAGIYGVLGLLLLFVSVLGYAILNGLNVDCGCFGPEELVGRDSLVHAFCRDLVLIGASTFLLFSRLARDRHRLSNRFVQNLPQYKEELK
jgi:uncharacterized membrane protein YphA (DoxX/SURF4 family)